LSFYFSSKFVFTHRWLLSPSRLENSNLCLQFFFVLIAFLAAPVKIVHDYTVSLTDYKNRVVCLIATYLVSLSRSIRIRCSRVNPLSSFSFFRSPALGLSDLTIFSPRSRSGELLGKFETLFSPFGYSNSSALPSSLFDIPSRSPLSSTAQSLRWALRSV